LEEVHQAEITAPFLFIFSYSYSPSLGKGKKKTPQLSACLNTARLQFAAQTGRGPYFSRY